MSHPKVSLLVVSKRPNFIAVILDMIAGQTYRDFEIVVILHGISWNALDATALTALESAAIVETVPAEWRLGRCLNHAISLSRGALLAKIDDDDLYGRDYLVEAVAAYDAGKGEIIGKTESYCYVAPARSVLLRLPGESHGEQKILRGGSLVFPRRLGLDPGFRDEPRHVDTFFLNDCQARGIRCYATSRRSMMIRRFDQTHGHTWAGCEARLELEAVAIKTGIVDDSPQALLKLIGG